MAKKRTKKRKTIKKTERSKKEEEVKKEGTRKKIDTKRQIASILMWASMVIFIFIAVNSLIAFVLWDDYVSQVDEQTMAELSEMEITLGELRSAFLYVIGACLVFTFLTFLLKYGIEKKNLSWGWLLSLSILFTIVGLFLIFTLVPGILGIVASILYATKKK